MNRVRYARQLGQAIAATLASPAGFARFALPLPAMPSLIGSEFFFQSATLSSGNPSGFVLGAGLRIAIGE